MRGRRQGRSSLLGWLGLALLLTGVAVVLVPVALFVKASSAPGVPVGEGMTTVEAPAGRTWGIYADDPDNSGYSEHCEVTAADGRGVPLRDPGFMITSSDTEMLDRVFTTPRGAHFTIRCDVRSATVRAAPVGSLRLIAIGLLAGILLAVGGSVAGALWLVARTATPAAYAPGG